MKPLLRKFWSKKNVDVNNNERVYTTKSYDETFSVPKNVLLWTGIRMAHNLTELRTKCWDFLYWCKVINVGLAIPGEFLAMVVTAMNAESFYKEGPKVFRTMPCLGVSVLSMIKSLRMNLSRNVFENLFYELREMWPRGEVTEDEHRILSEPMKQLNFIIRGYYWCNNALLVCYIAPQHVINLSRLLGYDTRMVLNFEYWMPFDPFQPGVFELVLFFQTWAGIVVIWWNTAWDMLFCTYLAHITAQFDLLARRVRKLVYVPVDEQLVNSYPLAKISRHFLQNEKNIVDSYNNHDWEVRHGRELVDIVTRHHALIRLAEDVEAMFSFASLINFMYSSIIICFCGFCCVMIEKWNEGAYKTFLMTALSQTWLLCWYGQKLLDSSHGIADALYESGWYRGSKRFKSAALIMLQRCQKGIHVTTYGFSTISLASYSTIIKTSWSYFTLLLNFYTSGGDTEV